MIIHKSNTEIQRMRDSGRLTAQTLENLVQYMQEGITTLELDQISYDFITSKNAKPSFLNYRVGHQVFHHSICASVNNEVVHGIPKRKKLKNGDIVKIDVGVYYKGYHGDSVRTYIIGSVPPKVQKLVDTSRQALYEGIKQAVPGNKLFNIGKAIQEYADSYGYSVVRDFTGHGIGTRLHEDPMVVHYYDKFRTGSYRMREGLVIAIEPMLNEGSWKVKVLKDGWTAVTVDGKLSAQYEHTVAVTKDGPIVLTELD